MKLDIFGGGKTRPSDEDLQSHSQELLDSLDSYTSSLATENFTRGFGAGRNSGRVFGDLFLSGLVSPSDGVAAAYYDVTYLFSQLMCEHGEVIFSYLRSLEEG